MEAKIDVRQTNAALSDQVVLLLVNGMAPHLAESYCVRQGVSPEDAASVVKSARGRITIAADYTRDEQIGRAVMRLDDLYAKSITSKDTKTALQAQRELNRLLNLYAGSSKLDAVDDAVELRRRLDLITGYVLPLGLVDENYPVEEHVRMASDLIRSHGLTAHGDQ